MCDFPIPSLAATGLYSVGLMAWRFAALPLEMVTETISEKSAGAVGLMSAACRRSVSRTRNTDRSLRNGYPILSLILPAFQGLFRFRIKGVGYLL